MERSADAQLHTLFFHLVQPAAFFLRLAYKNVHTPFFSCCTVGRWQCYLCRLNHISVIVNCCWTNMVYFGVWGFVCHEGGKEIVILTVGVHRSQRSKIKSQGVVYYCTTSHPTRTSPLNLFRDRGTMYVIDDITPIAFLCKLLLFLTHPWLLL